MRAYVSQLVQTSPSSSLPRAVVSDQLAQAGGGVSTARSRHQAVNVHLDTEPFAIGAHSGPVWSEKSIDSIYHEFCLAEAAGKEPRSTDYLAWYPKHADALRRLFDLHCALSVASLRRMAETSLDLPGAGDDIGPYRLLRLLGQGAFARVFLAEQSDLGNRLVVVKVSNRPSSEPTLLSRARHPHIVEVLRHIDDPENGLHLVCLPFLGGATLQAILDARGGTKRRRRSGRSLLTDLDRVSAPEYPRSGRARLARTELSRLNYPQAVGSLIASLAEALDHARRRGVIHGDLKPSNILLTADGIPMLFDFNLGSGDLEEHDSMTPVGGTLEYMAPERLRLLVDLIQSGNESSSARLRSLGHRHNLRRHRSDIYSLGLVFVEALTGESPVVLERRDGDFIGDAKELISKVSSPLYLKSVLQSRKIPQTIRPILSRCLAYKPTDRYAHGRQLADDLDRWKAGRPLASAPEPC